MAECVLVDNACMRNFNKRDKHILRHLKQCQKEYRKLRHQDEWPWPVENEYTKPENNRQSESIINDKSDDIII